MEEGDGDAVYQSGMGAPQVCGQIRTILVIIGGADMGERTIEGAVMMAAHQTIGIEHGAHHPIQSARGQAAQGTVARAEERRDCCAGGEMRISVGIMSGNGEQRAQGLRLGRLGRIAPAFCGIGVQQGEQPDLYASPRALEELGWAPRIPLEQSIRDALDYWRDRAHMEVD